MAVEAKICGLTDPADAAVAVEAGASYLGVVFAGGPRRVSARAAREVVAAAGSVPVFGVFGDAGADEILRMCSVAGLAGVQLHAVFSRETAGRLRAEGLPVWAVVRLGSLDDLRALDDSATDADAVLIEPAVSGLDGGTGVPLPRDLAVGARARLGARRLVLAGGLRPGSVAAAIAAVHPDIVDVSSGVERAPGRKDPALVRHFLEAVRGDQPYP